MKQTKEQLTITIANTDAKEWFDLASSAIMREAKCHSLANDEGKHPVLRMAAEAELETATRNANGNLLALRAAILAMNIAAGMPDEKAQDEADMLAEARVWHKHQRELEVLNNVNPE